MPGPLRGTRHTHQHRAKAGRVIRFDATGPVVPVVHSTPHAASLRVTRKRYAKQRGSPLWTTGTTSIETNRSGQLMCYLNRSIRFVIDSQILIRQSAVDSAARAGARVKRLCSSDGLLGWLWTGVLER